MRVPLLGLIRIAMGVAVGVLVVGCAGPGERAGERRGGVSGEIGGGEAGAAARVGGLPDHPAISRLRERAAAEIENPVDSAVIEPPEGLAFSDAELDEAATRSLDAVLERLVPAVVGREDAGLIDVDAAVEPAGDLDDPLRDLVPDSLRAYAAGRAAALEGDPNVGMRALEAATRIDPEAPAVWRALGEAQLRAGLRASAIRSFGTAADLGLDEPGILTLAGADAFSRRDFERAKSLLARAVVSERAQRVALALPVARVTLGRALFETGEVRAGAEAVTAGLRGVRATVAGTGFAREAAEIFRLRGRLWRQAGDAFVRLGDLDAASEAYERAAVLPSADPDAMDSRLVYAKAVGGRPAGAALVLLRRIAEDDGIVGERRLATLRTLAEVGGLGGILSESLSAIRDLLLAERGVLPDSIALSLDRARAAVLTDDTDRRRVLDAAIAGRDPLGDLDGRALLVDRLRLEAGDAEALVGAAVDVIGLHPDAATLVARAVLLTALDGRGVMDRLRLLAADDPPHRLLLGALLLEIGRADDAADLLAGPFEADGPLAFVLRSYGAMADARAGRGFALPGNLEPAGVAERLVMHRTAQIVREPSAAFGALAPLLHDVEVGVEVCLLGATAALRLGDAVAARDLLRRALIADRFDERAYEGLLTLTTVGGPLADADSFGETLRELRERLPGSRLVRRELANDLAGRGLLDEANDRLLALIEEDPGDGAAVQRIARVWDAMRADGSDRYSEALRDAEARIAAVRAACPAWPVLAEAHARLLQFNGETESAIAVLDAFESAMGATTAHDLQALLDDSFEGLADETPTPAERIASARAALDGGDPDPIEIASMIEEAVGPIESDVRPGEAAALASLVGAFVARANSVQGRLGEPEDPWTLATRRVVVAGLRAGVPVTPAVGALPVDLAARGGAGVREILEAVDLVEPTESDERTRLLNRAAVQLNGAGSTDEAIGLLAAAADQALLDVSVWDLWFRFVASLGTVDDARRLVASVDDAARMDRAIASVRPEGDAFAGEVSAAQLAYILAAYVGAFRDQDAGRAFLRYALELEPGHPWASNDLGYAILDAAGPGDVSALEEAGELISAAYRQLPERDNVIDSMGWWLYRTGQLFDVETEDGAVVEGALTLLERAAEMAGDEDTGTIWDHLGDARYLAEDADGARSAWARAQRLVGNAMREASAGTRQDRVEELTRRLRSIGAKIRAVREGLAPAVAPSPAAERPGAPPVQPAVQSGVRPGVQSGVGG